MRDSNDNFSVGIDGANSVFNIPAGSSPTNVSVVVPFSAGASYHWRVVATNIRGSTNSPD